MRSMKNGEKIISNRENNKITEWSIGNEKQTYRS